MLAKGPTPLTSVVVGGGQDVGGRSGHTPVIDRTAVALDPGRFPTGPDGGEAPRRRRLGRVPIPPDTKDWTWVLHRPCPECGFDPADHPRDAFGSVIRDNALSWAAELSEGAASFRTVDDRWSTLEYGCHVRDVYRIFDGRLTRMLTMEDPTFADWDQDAAAEDDRYDQQDPARVALELAEAAATVATRFDGVHGGQWERPGTRSNGSAFTVETLGRYLVHDPIHHLWDVREGIRTVR